ncbi:MAG: serine--tRNA ligase [Candidatus Vogelbacteria bacterium CG22_combo_CG10-13_8_21_14_all_37_9]|uniref:Serine--tRNA ligase n=1 Tax=Candidatus Vogelbacteria bacterium CG22_combo_CG10-13_8_21_14_all_37_9 TaxID=1975046 RepID=A0A2H0BL61_9BACT|nr:MAG: serine--tRNA ligase [bacterium CG10_37_50]PIP58415.1 MAG: serine--tRNA ligase [Candidatus Vogelbacteria bacterium CG22_combo_CG10-13_8_21_14_all_37_9]
MLDIKFIRENKELIAEAARKKRLKFKVEDLLAVDEKRVKLLIEVETKRAHQNKISTEIAQDTSKREENILAMKSLKEELQNQETELKEIIKNWQALMVQVPNVPDISVPDGDDDSNNVELKTNGERPQFPFIPKSHIELMQNLHLVDLERGTKVAGFRGYFLKNEGLRLSFALWQYAFDLLQKESFTPMMVPSLVRPDSFYGTAYLPQGEEDLYKTQDGDYLAGTAEVAMMGYHMDEIVPIDHLPLKFVSWSPCFRREAGSHGKDTRGLIRLHEFYKVEQVVLCEANHEESVRWHEALLANAEKLMQGLKLPYRVVVNCSGDLGLGQVKKYDIEAWVPSENKYRETHSISYFHDFQARRLNLKYKDLEGKTHLVHSLNGTAVASPRILVSLLENYQQADGSVIIPEVLRPYLGGQEIIR